MDTAFKEQMDSYCAAFKGVLAQYLQSVHFRPDILDESMRYSLENGGKRLRRRHGYARRIGQHGRV